MTLLSVNLNAVAFLRNRRSVPWPDLIVIARAVLAEGAGGITVHPRPDERHIKYDDVLDLAHLLQTEFPQAEFNVEGYPTEDFMELVKRIRPHQVTLVPDLPGQSTSDHGWDIDANGDDLRRHLANLKSIGSRTAIFIEPDPDAPARAWDIGADRVEMFTGPYGGALKAEQAKRQLKRLIDTADASRHLGHNCDDAGRSGLHLNAGHDLTLDNLPLLLEAIPDIAEVSVGHGLTAEALMVGFPEATRRYLAVTQRRAF